MRGPRARTEQCTMSEFSLDLDEDQLQLQKWVHDFSENVVRPAGHEWDEREETPWPIIQEAANIGLYSFEFVTNAFLDKSGLLMPIAAEELAWGDAGIAPGELLGGDGHEQSALVQEGIGDELEGVQADVGRLLD